MEYHIPQLADVCATSVGHVHVDAAEPTQDHAAHVTLPRTLRRVLACGAVHLRHEPHQRRATYSDTRPQPQADWLRKVSPPAREAIAC